MNNHTPTKRCTQCGNVYPATREYFHKSGKYLQSCCKTCRSVMRLRNSKAFIDLPNEAWVDIPDYEHIYQVSNLGRVRSVRGSHSLIGGKLITLTPSGNGYLHFTAAKNGDVINLYVHRLVALLFIGDAPDGHIVNHKNGQKQDNRIDNLEYVTPSENNLHAFRVLGHRSRSGERVPTSKLTAKQVKEIRNLYASGGVTQQQLADRYGVVAPCIHQIVKRKTWKDVA